MEKQQVERIIHGRWVIPVEPLGTTLAHHAIVIDRGKIVAIEPSANVLDHFTCTNIDQCDHHILIPGLVNAHTHSPMSLMRGLADDIPLMDWLHQYIWPVESAHIGEDFIAAGTELAIAEMLRSGTTCFNDMYFFPDVTAHCAAQAGIRATVGLIFIDFPTAWAKEPNEYFAKNAAVHDEYRNHNLVSTAFAPHAPYSVSDEPLLKMQTLVDELNIPIHMHIHETQDEITQSQTQYGCRPLQRLHKLGLLTPSLLAVHMTQLDEQDFALIADSGMHIVHCPESNMKLASGFCPTAKLAQLGINVALGTDGAASNNDLDMFGEMRSAALLAKVYSADAAALSAEQTLYMATMGGAKALDRAQEIGSLQVNKSADIVAVDISELESQPMYHPISHLVYATTRNQVSDVWVAGERLLKDRQLTQLDVQAIIAKAHYWSTKIGQHLPNLAATDQSS